MTLQNSIFPGPTVLRLGPLHPGVFNIADFTIVIGFSLLAASLRSARKAGSTGR